MNRFYTYRIGIKWVTVKDLKIKYTPILDRATIWNSRKSALSWKKKIQEKYPLAEIIELKLEPAQ